MWTSLDVEPVTPDGHRPEGTSVPPHAIALPGGGWRLWRTLALRGAGFPARLLIDLASPPAAAAADRYRAAVREKNDRLAGELVRLRELSRSDDENRTRIRAQRRRLRRGLIEPGASEEPERAALAAAIEQEKAARAEAAAVFAAEGDALRKRLAAIAGDATFREAALWQNPEALGYARKAIDRRGGQKQREAAEFIALLAQRYAGKNDTCGFFGPAGFATFDEGAGYLRIEPALELTTRRSVYFEDWAIDRLTVALDRIPGLKRWAVPRLNTGVWLGPDGPYLPGGGRVDVSDLERRVLNACDGATTADALAARLVHDPSLGLQDESELFEVLRRLVEARVMSWKLEVAPQLHPERDLARAFARIGDAPLRERCEAALAGMLEARHGVAAATGDPDRLARALELMNETFTRLTGDAPTRSHGLIYAARSLLYLDGCRAGVVTLGQGFLDELGPPLTIVLDAARWLVGELTTALGECVRQCHADLRQRLSCDAVDPELLLDHARSGPWLEEEVPRRFDELQAQFQAKWAEVLGEPLEESPHRVRYGVEGAVERARAVFPSRPGTWSLAREFSPDLMVSAAGPDAFQRGEFDCVLGELHCGNTITWSAIAAQHPALEELLAAVEADSGGEVVFMRQRRRRKNVLARANPMLVLPTFWRYELGEDLSSLPRCRPLPAAFLQAIDDGREVRLRARDGSFECSALELFTDWLPPPVNDMFGQLRPKSGHLPRITLGRLTIARERWELAPADLPFLAETDRSERFAAVRAWADGLGIPRFVFYKTPAEPKPCYLDFCSPVFVDVFARLARRMTPADVVKVVEMKPRIDETWLADGRGARYTCELRVVARPARA